MMHSIIYRTNLLRECGLRLPKHTSYVDNLFVFLPLKYIKNMYYLNVDFYRYFMGREDQSVNEAVMIRRIDQQIEVNKLMIESSGLGDVKSEKLYKYMINHLEIVTVISCILLIRSGTKKNLEKKKKLWRYIKETDKQLYRALKHGFMGRVINLPGSSGRKVCIGAYKISKKIVGFN